MPAERTPPSETSRFADLLARATRLVLRFPRTILGVALLAALFSLGLSGARLGLEVGRIEPWADGFDESGAEKDALVVVEGPGREPVVSVLEEIAAGLARDDGRFRAVLYKVDLSRLRAAGLYYLAPEDLSAMEKFLDRVEPIVRGQWCRLNLGHAAEDALALLAAQRANPSSAASDAAEMQVGMLADGLAAALEGEGRCELPWLIACTGVREVPRPGVTPGDSGPSYLLTEEGRLGFVLVRLESTAEDGSVRRAENIAALRRMIAGIRRENPEVKIGLTGPPVMEHDEFRSSQATTPWTWLLALLGVAGLSIVGFGGLRPALPSIVALLTALAWSLGYATLAVGHVNVLSIQAGAILIGLGAGFGIHYAADYQRLRSLGRRSGEALAATAAVAGPCIIAGAAAAAVALLLAGRTGCTEVGELGTIAGGGIVLCGLAALVVLPALIYLSDARRRKRVLPAPLDVRPRVERLLVQPIVVASVTLAIAAGVSLGISRLRYDHNLLNLRPAGLESVRLERRLLVERRDRSNLPGHPVDLSPVSCLGAGFALSVADNREDLMARKARFLGCPSVERVDEIASLLPVGLVEKRPIIERIRKRLADLPERAPAIPVDDPADLERRLASVQALLGTGPKAARLRQPLQQARNALRQLPPARAYARLAGLQQSAAEELLSRLDAIRAAADPAPPGLNTLPEGLVARFTGRDNRFLMRVYARGDLAEISTRARFVSDVRSVDPRAAGAPLQAYEASRRMERGHGQLVCYGLAAILLILYLSFRDVGCALLALIPPAVALAASAGLMGILGIPLSPVNAIALPLVLGLGVSGGIQVVHDFRRQLGEYRMSATTSASILLGSLSAMAGFGTLMLAGHRGLQDLGRVLTIGTACCLLASLVVLPLMLAWLRRQGPPGHRPHKSPPVSAALRQAVGSRQ
jgi:predicted exporter